MDRAKRLFNTLMRTSSQIGENTYTATTAKRRTLVIPVGVTVLDTDLNKYFSGDGVTYGGVSEDSTCSIRKIPVNAASDTGLSASATTDRITWTTIGGKLRTGDAITLAAGTGTIPSGLTATTYWIVKDTTPDSDSFKVSSSRANAIAGTTINIVNSGAAGYTAVIDTVCIQGFEDILLLDPVGVAASVVLPDADSNDGMKVTVKRAAAGDFAISVKELASDGTVSASGDVTIDDVAGYGSFGSGSTAGGATYFADGDSGEWFTM